MRITTCASLADEWCKEKRHSVESGVFCVNDGAMRYGPRRVFGCFIDTFLCKPTRGGIFSATQRREV